jgi:hypothetical protein
MTADARGLAGTIRAAGAKQKNEAKTELSMSVLAPNQTNEAALKLERSLKSSHLQLKAAPSFVEERVDLRQHMSLVGRIYQVSGAGSGDGHYCPFCYDSGGTFARMHRDANNWQCGACDAVLYD